MPTLPISKTQLDKLGDRLRDAEPPTEADLTQLTQVIGAYDEALHVVRDPLRGLGFDPAIRLKTTGTLIDKLRRNRASSLKTVQDLVGARIIVPGRLTDQDAAREAIVRAGPSASMPATGTSRSWSWGRTPRPCCAAPTPDTSGPSVS